MPSADRYWTDDATTEALAVLLLENQRGLVMVRDELDGWLRGFDQYRAGKGADVPRWLELFGGRPLIVDRKTTGTVYVPRPFLCVTGGIQPATLRRSLGEEHRENGMAARLLFALPPRRRRQWTEADVRNGTEVAVSEVFEAIFNLKSDTGDDGDPRPRIVRLTPSAKEAWIKFYDEHADRQTELTGDLAAAWSKLEGYAARFALIVHCIRVAAGDDTVADPDLLDEKSIAAGVSLSRWFGNEARRVYSILAESEEDGDRRRLVEMIRAKGGSLSVRDLQRTDQCRYKTAPDARIALQDLVEAGIGVLEFVKPTAQGGRSSERFRLNDAA